MPTPALKSMAEKHGVSIDTAERYWKEAKKSAASSGHTDDYAYIMGIVKRRMGVSSSAAAAIVAAFMEHEGLIKETAASAGASTIDKIIAYESGELEDDDVIDLFAELIKSGLAWQLQGSYGRQATQFINSGVISRQGKILNNGESARMKLTAAGETQETTTLVTCTNKDAIIEVSNIEETEGGSGGYAVSTLPIGTSMNFPDENSAPTTYAQIKVSVLSNQFVKIQKNGKVVVKKSAVVRELKGKTASIKVNREFLTVIVDGTPRLKTIVGQQVLVQEYLQY